jgi:hypothetical protein
MTAETLDSAAVKTSRAYEADYYGWIEDQVALLKAGRLSEIDTQNIAEEIKDIGTRQYDHLENAARALIYNLLKWDLQPDRRSPSMVLSIDAHRDQITRLLDRNPSLASDVPEALSDAYLYATYDMMRDSDLAESVFAPECPYDWDTIRTREVEFDAVVSPSSSDQP